MDAAPAGDSGPELETLPRLWTLQEVAAQTGLNYWWLRRACANRRIEYTKAGKSIMLTTAQVYAAVEAAKVPKAETPQPAPPTCIGAPRCPRTAGSIAKDPDVVAELRRRLRSGHYNRDGSSRRQKPQAPPSLAK